MTPTAEATTSRDSTTLSLLREWQSVCDATLAGQNHLLIRKGGIAEGRDGFQVRRSFFGLLPTLFHQARAADIDVPAPPSMVRLVCQLVETFVVPSDADLSSLAPFHGYGTEQLATRQQYKPDRPLNLILIRPFRLRVSVEVDTAKVRPVCKSWAEVDVSAGLGGIDPVADMATMAATIDAARRAIEALPGVRILRSTAD